MGIEIINKSLDNTYTVNNVGYIIFIMSNNLKIYLISIAFLKCVEFNNMIKILYNLCKLLSYCILELKIAQLPTLEKRTQWKEF